MYAVADAHVDALWRMVTAGGDLEPALASSPERLRQGGVALQVFALYASAGLPPHAQWDQVLEELDYYYAAFVAQAGVTPVVSAADLSAGAKTGLRGVLALEGAGCLAGQTWRLRTLHRLGVRGLGLTWNWANDLADGCLEARGAGLTSRGREVIREVRRLGMWVDLAHLSEAGIRDVFRMLDGPVMASHANARSVHPHPRNLTDDVLREVFARGGFVGVTFEASFVTAERSPGPAALFRHIDHMLSLGGEDNVGFGSDFDGLSRPLPGLATAADYAAFARQIAARYGHALAEKLLIGNLMRFLRSALPSADLRDSSSP